jgi:arginyl-tRNA synthetase
VRAHQGELGEAEVRAIGEAIAVGALRYFMLRFGRNKVVAFDFEEALKFQGETGPYLQNSVVRCASIFRKAAERLGLGAEAIAALDPDGDLGDLGQLDEDAIWDLVLQLGRLDEVLVGAVQSLELSLLARWAFQTAQRFHKFYERFRILGEDDEARRRLRALVVWLYRERMGQALEVMGIPVPARM